MSLLPLRLFSATSVREFIIQLYRSITGAKTFDTIERVRKKYSNLTYTEYSKYQYLCLITFRIKINRNLYENL